MTRRRPLGLAVCDRCGLDCRHSELRKEWSGVYVCPKCYETKHPQLTPRKVPGGDPRPLVNARPPQKLVVDVEAIDIRHIWPDTAGGGDDFRVRAEDTKPLTTEDGQELET
jgi:hypothetical protein